MNRTTTIGVVAALTLTLSAGGAGIAHAAPPATAQPLTSVTHDATLTGSGTTASPLTVVSPYNGVVHDGATLEGAGTAASPLRVVRGAASGAVIAPSAPAYSGTVVDVLFTSADSRFDTDAYVGTSQLVITQTGIYLLTMKGGNDRDGSFLVLYYSVNNGPFEGTCVSLGTAGVYPLCSGSELLQLSAGDTIRFGVYSSSDNVTRLRFGIARQ
jgi:hypothetical protein